MYQYNDNEFRYSDNFSNIIKLNKVRQSAVELKTDLHKRLENPFMLNSKFKKFDFTNLIQLFKNELYIDNATLYENLNLHDKIRFIIEQINPVVSMDIKHQVDIDIIGADDLTSVIINVFTGALIGERSINIEIFNIIEKSSLLKDYCGYEGEISTSYQLFFHYKKMAYIANNWLKDKKFITTTISPLYMITPDEYLNIKLLLLGKSSTGKSSFINRYRDSTYDIKNLNLTIGIDMINKKKIINYLNQNIGVNVHIWDTAGQEKYAPLNNTYLRNVNGILFVFDMSDNIFLNLVKKEINTENFDLKNIFKKYLLDKNKLFHINSSIIENQPYVYFGNKTDLINENILNDIDINYLKMFVIHNYKYNKTLEQEYKYIKITEVLDNDYNNINKLCLSILKDGKCENYYWGSVIDNLNTEFTINNLIYNTVSKKLNDLDEDVYNENENNKIKISNKKYVNLSCCKTM